MRNISFAFAAMMSVPCLFAVDGVVLINQSTVLAAGGFPYQITQSGSYRLTGNLTVPDADTTAIQVTANDVTIDLNGFGIIGPTICTGPAGSPVTSCAPLGRGFGIGSAGSSSDLSVSNGFVRGMGSTGIGIATEGSVQNVRAISNGLNGIVAYNVSGSVASFNGQAGIISNQGTLSGNTTLYNGKVGILSSCPGSVVGNTANGNGLQNLSLANSTCTAANNAAP